MVGWCDDDVLVFLVCIHYKTHTRKRVRKKERELRTTFILNMKSPGSTWNWKSYGRSIFIFSTAWKFLCYQKWRYRMFSISFVKREERGFIPFWLFLGLTAFFCKCFAFGHKFCKHPHMHACVKHLFMHTLHTHIAHTLTWIWKTHVCQALMWGRETSYEYKLMIHWMNVGIKELCKRDGYWFVLRLDFIISARFETN